MAQTQQIHDYFWLVVELAKSLAWPLAAIILVALVLPKLKDFVTALPAVFKNRRIEVKAAGFEAKVGAAEQQQQAANDNLPAVTLGVPSALPTATPAIALMEESLRAYLAKIPEADQQGQLVRALALAQLAGGHEYVYNRIFGSQIAALRRLDIVGAATISDAQAFFKPFTDQYPEIYRTYTFDGWLEFMVHSKLIAREGDRLTVTPIGHEFLVYLSEARLSEAKYG